MINLLLKVLLSSCLTATSDVHFPERHPIPVTAAFIACDSLPELEYITMVFEDSSFSNLAPVVKDFIEYSPVGQELKNERFVFHGRPCIPDSCRSRNYIIKVSRKGYYEVILQDGTTVRMNESSTLTVPASYHCSERRVKIQGEAFFTVAKNDLQPFVVESQSQEIVARRGSFNVNAYPNEVAITTVATGQVKVVRLASGEEKRLKAKQQLRMSPMEIHVLEVDTMPYFAWLRNMFEFNGTSVAEALSLMARWYGFKVGYIPEKPLYAHIHRHRDREGVLSAIERIASLKFKLENGVLTAI